MSHLRRDPSVPVWTALAGSSSRSTAAPSDSSPSSSQEMDDELAGTPAPSPPPSPDTRKRKKHATSHAEASAPKRSRIEGFTQAAFTREGGSNRDIPASAHAKPVRPPPSTQPSRSRPLSSHAATAGRRAFEQQRGPMPTSASPLASDSDSNRAKSPPRRLMANKLAATGPHAMKKSQDGHNQRRSATNLMLPPATAPSRIQGSNERLSSSKLKDKHHSASSSEGSVDFPRFQVLNERLRPKPRNPPQTGSKLPSVPRGNRRHTIATASNTNIDRSNTPNSKKHRNSSPAHSPHRRKIFPKSDAEIIELSSDDDAPPHRERPPPVERNKSRAHSETITITDSESDGPPVRGPVDKSSIAKSASATKSPTPFQDEAASSLDDGQDHGMSVDLPESPSIAGNNSTTLFTNESPSREDGSGDKAGIFAYQSSLPTTAVEPQGFGTGFLEAHQAYSLPVSRSGSLRGGCETPERSNTTLAPDPHSSITHALPSTPALTRLSLPRDVSAQQVHDDTIRQQLHTRNSGSSAPSSAANNSPLHPGSPSLDEHLVPALDDMELEASSSASQVSAHSATRSRSMDIGQSEGVVDSFEHWSAKDGSNPATPDGSESSGSPVTPQSNQSAELPQVPAPQPAKRPADVDFLALARASAKKPTARKSAGFKPVFNFTPVTTSRPSSGGSVPSPSQIPRSPGTPTITRQRPAPPAVEVIGSLYSGDNGFYRAVLRSSSRSGSASSLVASDSPKQPSPTRAPAALERSLVSSGADVEPPPSSAPSDRSATPSGGSDSSSSIPRLSLPAELRQGLSQEASSPELDTAGHQPISRSPSEGKPGPQLQEKTSKSNVPPIPRSILSNKKPRHSSSSSLGAAIADAQLEKAVQDGIFIDLTISDDEEDLVSRAVESTKLLASLVPEIMGDHVPVKAVGDVEMASPPLSTEGPMIAADSSEEQQSGPADANLDNAQRRLEELSQEMAVLSTQGAVVEDGEDEDEEFSVESILNPSSSRHSPDIQDTAHVIEIEGPVLRRSRRVATRSSSSNSSLAARRNSSAENDGPRRATSYARVQRIDRTRIIDDEDIEGMTWANHGRIIGREFADLCLLAKNLPHDLQDYLNTLPEWVRRANNLQRKVFASMIVSNTAEDEQDAPPIEIINNVDDDQSPPFEFYYTNLMWHSENVPKPDFDRLRGCDCYPTCADSKTCACARKQLAKAREAGYEGNGYLAYTNNGRLKPGYHGYPVMECNELCSCEDDCKNRVVQHGRRHAINIQKTKDKGWGVFAAQKIPAHTFIGIYSGEYITSADSEERGQTYHLGDRTYLFDIDFWYLKGGNEDWESRYCIDAYHAGNFTRYLNHSCDPNCQITPVYVNESNIQKPLVAIYTNRELLPGDELCFSYFGQTDEDELAREAERTGRDNIFVPCRCGAPNCTGRMWK